jgi:MATE family, multidrug efflux pump
MASHAAAVRRADAWSADREIWTLAWPVILSQILSSGVSLIDIGMLGRLGPFNLAAVGYVTQIFLLTQAVLFAVGTAGVALMARALGAGDPARARAALASCLGVSLLAGVAIAGVVLAIPREILVVLNAKPEVIDAALPYLRLTMLSTLLFAVSITLECGFRAARDTRTPLVVALVVTSVKTLLNWLLIFGPFGLPRYGLAGAGAATLAAQVVAVLLFGTLSQRLDARRPLALARADVRAARANLGEVTRISAPAVLERLVLNLALLDYFRMLGDYGSTAVAAYTVGVRMMSFSWIPGIGFAAAAATLVGHALGKDDPGAAVRAGWRAARLAVGVSIVLGLVFGLGRAPLARVFTNDASVLTELGPFMLTLALTQPLLGFHFTISGALRGAGDTVTPLVAAATGNWAFRVPLAMAFTHMGLPVVWMWIVLVFDHVARATIVGTVYVRGRWKHRKLAVRS